MGSNASKAGKGSAPEGPELPTPTGGPLTDEEIDRHGLRPVVNHVMKKNREPQVSVQQPLVRGGRGYGGV